MVENEKYYNPMIGFADVFLPSDPIKPYHIKESYKTKLLTNIEK